MKTSYEETPRFFAGFLAFFLFFSPLWCCSTGTAKLLGTLGFQKKLRGGGKQNIIFTLFKKSECGPSNVGLDEDGIVNRPLKALFFLINVQVLHKTPWEHEKKNSK